MTEQPTICDLCRRWRYTEAKFKADCIVAEDVDPIALEAEEQLKALEEQILAADPAVASVGDAVEIVRVVLDLIGEDSVADHREHALLRQALKALAWADPGRASRAA